MYKLNLCYSFSLKNILKSKKDYTKPLVLKGKNLLAMAFSSAQTVSNNISQEYELPFSFQETTFISSLCKGKLSSVKVLNGRSCTFNAFIENFANNEIVHLSTHTSFSNAKNTGKVFFRKGIEIDAIKVQSINIPNSNPELIYLSSCGSADGNVFNHENGPSSIANHFAASNSKFIVATYWNIDDKRSYIFAKNLYPELLKEENSFLDVFSIAVKNYQKIYRDMSIPYRVILN